MLSSEAGAAELITDRIGLVNLLPAILPAGGGLVLLMVLLVTIMSVIVEPTHQAAHIKMIVIV